MPKKKKIRSFEEIINEMKEQEAMSCSPGIPHRKANFITDPDKSVNWNRQQVIQNNDARDKAIIRLNTEKNEWRGKLFAEIQEAILAHLSNRITAKGAKSLWFYAYEHGHAEGLDSVLSTLMELLKIFEVALEGKD